MTLFFKITRVICFCVWNKQGYSLIADVELATGSRNGVVVISAKKHKRQRRKRQSVNAKREKSQTPKFFTAILTLPNLT